MLEKLFDLVFDLADKTLDTSLHIVDKAFDVATSDKAFEIYGKTFDATCAITSAILITTLSELNEWLKKRGAYEARVKECIKNGNFNTVNVGLYDQNSDYMEDATFKTKENFHVGQVIHV